MPIRDSGFSVTSNFAKCTKIYVSQMCFNAKLSHVVLKTYYYINWCQSIW